MILTKLDNAKISVRVATVKLWMHVLQSGAANYVHMTRLVLEAFEIVLPLLQRTDSGPAENTSALYSENLMTILILHMINADKPLNKVHGGTNPFEYDSSDGTMDLGTDKESTENKRPQQKRHASAETIINLITRKLWDWFDKTEHRQTLVLMGEALV